MSNERESLSELADGVVREMYSVLTTQWDRDCLRAKVLTALRSVSRDVAATPSMECPNCHNANKHRDYEGPACEVCMGDGFVAATPATRDELAAEFAKRFPAVLAQYSQFKIVDWFTSAVSRPEPAATLPTKLTGEMACILENCDPPENQTPEAVAALIADYQPTWDRIVSAVSRPIHSPIENKGEGQ